jgi:hypothetical protein
VRLLGVLPLQVVNRRESINRLRRRPGHGGGGEAAVPEPAQRPVAGRSWHPAGVAGGVRQGASARCRRLAEKVRLTRSCTYRRCALCLCVVFFVGSNLFCSSSMPHRRRLFSRFDFRVIGVFFHAPMSIISASFKENNAIVKN